MSTLKYLNKINDEYQFSLMSNGNIMWSGLFRRVRTCHLELYDKAYDKYLEDGGTLSMSQFQSLMYQPVWDADSCNWTELHDKYKSLVYHDPTSCTIVNPAGGPFINKGMHMSMISNIFNGKRVDKLIKNDYGYEIICVDATDITPVYAPI